MQKLISNPVPSIGSAQKFAAILGENPSKGARSPVLWNAAFKALDIPCGMLPLDVTEENLLTLLEVLDADQRFMGGAIAVPHKESIAKWLFSLSELRLSSEAKAIGAVNCLYRNNIGILCGTNTDGEGAMASLSEVYPTLNMGKKVLLLGLGGAGKAVAVYVRKAIGDDGELELSVRKPLDFKDFAKKIDSKVSQWPPTVDRLKGVDVLINCSIVGSNHEALDNNEVLSYKNFTPLACLDQNNQHLSLDKLKLVSNNGIVFDIIYDPNPTQLLKLSQALKLSVLGGGAMNLEQAVLAFQYAIQDHSKQSLIRRAMSEASLKI